MCAGVTLLLPLLSLYTLTLPDSSVESWSYDANGNVASYTNALLQTVGYSYNDSGDQVGVDYPTGTDTSFSYDAVGRWAGMADATGASGWVFNTVGQVTSLTTPQGSFSYTYNAWGQPATMVDSSGTWTTLYDQYHRAYGATNPWGETTTVAFDPSGRVSRKDLPNGMYETYSFDSRSRLTHVRTYDSSSVLQDTKQYVWDAASRVTSATEGGVVTTYGYDLVDQLTSESRSGYSASYTYDANGNRLSRTVNSVTETYSYDDADKLLSVSGGSNPRTFGYDAAGRTTSITSGAGVTSFTYDYESRVTSITYPNATTDSHTYNGLGARVGSSGASGTKTFRRAGIGVTSPVMSDGGVDYTPGVSSRSGGVTKYQHDGLKNATEQSSSSQTIAASRQYDAFGNLTASSGSWQGAFGYGGDFGYQEDASGLKLLGHRYYDSSTGRFVTSDPSGAGSNWYCYGGNNPISSADPYGLKETVIIIVGAGLQDDTHNEQVLDSDMKGIAEQYRDRLEDQGYDVEILYVPDEEQLDSAIKRADGLVFIGHGNLNRNYGRIRGSGSKKTGKTTLKLEASRIKHVRGSKKLKFLVLESCSLGAAENIGAWLEVADGVAAYAANDHFPRRNRGTWDPPKWSGTPRRGVVIPRIR